MFLFLLVVLGTSCESALLSQGEKSPVGALTGRLDSLQDTMTLTWTPVDGAVGYEVQQNNDSSGWETLPDEPAAATLTVPLPPAVQKEIPVASTKWTVQWRVRAVLAHDVSTYSAPLSQELSLGFAVLPVDGDKKYKVSDDGTNYRAELLVRNDGNVTIHNMTFLIGLYDSPPWFDGGNGAYSTGARAGFADAIAPGGTASVVTSVPKISWPIFTTAYMMTTPLVDVN